MLGPALALLCAISWAIAIVFWRKAGNGVHAFALNVFKNGFALALVIPTVFILRGKLSLQANTNDILLLILSGTIGIGISDALYLWSLNLIGASRLAIIDCIYSPSIMLLAWLILGETLFPLQILGAVLVLSAVFLVTHDTYGSTQTQKTLTRGSIVCAVSIVSMAGGILMVKPIFARVDLFWVILIRLAAGFLSSLVITLALPKRREIFRSLYTADHKGKILIASFLGTYVSMICWVAGFKYNKAAIAAILNQTTTFFTVISAAIFLHEPLTRRKIVATLLAFVGVLLITIA